MPTLRNACVCAASLFLLLSCNNKKKTTEEKQPEIKSESAFHEKEPPLFQTTDYHNSYERMAAQHFTVSGKERSELVAAGGLKVKVVPADLEKADGTALRDPIQVKIIELQSSQQLFKCNAATVSNGKLLASGGSYYIGMESAGQQVKIKKNRKLQVSFPVISKDEMELFYGERDATGNLNWKRAGQFLEEAPEELTFKSDTRYDYDGVSSGYSNSAVYRYQKPVQYLSGRVFKNLEEDVYYYNLKLSVKKLLDTVNRTSMKVCLDTVSFWPVNLPKNVKLDTGYLTYLYGPRIQYKLKKCTPDNEADQLVNEGKPKVAENNNQPLVTQIRKYYADAQVQFLGWLNCDRYYNDPQQTEMEFSLPFTLNNNRINYFIIYKKFNGLMSGNIVVKTDSAFRLSGLPANEEVKLIAFTRNNGIVYQASTDLRTENRKKIKLELKEISVSMLNKIFGSNIKT